MSYAMYACVPCTQAIHALEAARKGYEGDKLAFAEAIEMLRQESTHEALCLMHDEREYALYLANEFESRGMHDAATAESHYANSMLDAMRVVMRLR